MISILIYNKCLRICFCQIYELLFMFICKSIKKIYSGLKPTLSNSPVIYRLARYILHKNFCHRLEFIYISINTPRIQVHLSHCYSIFSTNI